MNSKIVEKTGFDMLVHEKNGETLSSNTHSSSNNNAHSNSNSNTHSNTHGSSSHINGTKTETGASSFDPFGIVPIFGLQSTDGSKIKSSAKVTASGLFGDDDDDYSIPLRVVNLI